MSEEKARFVNNSQLFSSATDKVVRGYEHLFAAVTFRRGKILYEQGEPGRFVYLMISGRVRISRMTESGEELTIAMLGRYDLFGEEAAFRSVVRSTSALCVEDSEIYIADARDLYSLFSHYALNALRTPSADQSLVE